MEKEHKKDRQCGLYLEAGLVQANRNQALGHAVAFCLEKLRPLPQLCLYSELEVWPYFCRG